MLSHRVCFWVLQELRKVSSQAMREVAVSQNEAVRSISDEKAAAEKREASLKVRVAPGQTGKPPSRRPGRRPVPAGAPATHRGRHRQSQTIAALPKEPDAVLLDTLSCDSIVLTHRVLVLAYNGLRCRYQVCVVVLHGV